MSAPVAAYRELVLPTIEPAGGECSRRTMRSCAGSRAKSLIRTRGRPRRALSRPPRCWAAKTPPADAPHRIPPQLWRTGPTNSYAWQGPVSATDARRSKSRSRRAAVVGADPPVGPSSSPSAASSIRYWRAGDDVTMAWSCLQT